MRGIPYTPQSVDLFGSVAVDMVAMQQSYSADTIGMHGKIRKPFKMDGAEWTSTGSCGSGAGDRIHSIYRLCSLPEFSGKPTTYKEKIHGDGNHGESARKDPNGFYHGMTVHHGGKCYVITGPEYSIESSPEDYQDYLRATYHTDRKEDEDAIADEYDDDDDDLELDDDDDLELEDDDDEDSYTGARDPRNDRPNTDLTDEDDEDDYNGEPIDDDDFIDETRIAVAIARLTSSTLCKCGHAEKDHFNTDECGCHWSEGSGKHYRNCECDAFEPADESPAISDYIPHEPTQLGLFGGAL